jgi:hypothetical protein
MKRSIGLAMFLSLGMSGLAAQDNLPPRVILPSDPTVPTQEIRARLQPPPQPELPAVAMESNAPAIQTNVITTPPLPKLRIRSIVIATDRSGTAQIDMGGEKISVGLEANKYGVIVPMPGRQFPKPIDLTGEAAVEQAKADQEALEATYPAELRSDMIQTNDLILEVLSHTERQVVFMAHPLGKLVIAR